MLFPSIPDGPIGFLLLRDGHAVPLKGISPEDIKAGAKHLVPNPESNPLRHRKALTAIIKRLGFKGDFGDYKNLGWPAFQRFLKEHNCTHYAGMFPSNHGGCIDLFLTDSSEVNRRNLADRLFESEAPRPSRVFLGYGVDWAAWDSGSGHSAPERSIPLVGGDSTTARERAEVLFQHRLKFWMQWGFLDSKLVDGPVQDLIDKTYWQPDSDPKKRERNLTQLRTAVKAFRAVFDASPEGWANVLPFNDRLAVLSAFDGAWDLVWRSYRATEPPIPANIERFAGLDLKDLPRELFSRLGLGMDDHVRQGFWDEKEAHEAEQAFYDRGGSPEARRRTPNVHVRAAWLREQGQLNLLQVATKKPSPPPGFNSMRLGGKHLAVGPLTDVGSYREMLADSGYLNRRDSSAESWHRANDGVPDTLPVGATWADAQAYCAWMERRLGVSLRLPTVAELREMRGFYSERYANMVGGDFLWENFPPRPLTIGSEAGQRSRIDLPTAVQWSEPRFLEPGPQRPEFPPDDGISSHSRKRWIGNFPPSAPWKEKIPWVTHNGLHFIDAWDAYEWCQEQAWVSGRFWQGFFATHSWGAYKNFKVCFRLVVELEG